MDPYLVPDSLENTILLSANGTAHFRDDDELYRRFSDIPSATIGNLGGSLLAEGRERKEDNSFYGYATGGGSDAR